MSPVLTEHSFDIVTHSAAQTFRVGERLGRLTLPGDVICLNGDLGAGKTCLTQGIGAGLRVQGTITSPTFVYINEHVADDAQTYLYHVDLYRIRDYADAFALGLEDYIYDDGVTVIEWADRAIEIMPPDRLWISLTFVEYTKRTLLFEASGERYVQLLRALKEDLFGHKRDTTPAP
ncbi:MAG: tRNA (adenosine(37)-N6)-threonylcarbamoyltransferase complex ATPase subunit type 1 TsaE [Chloroflexota bacterium]